MGTPAIIIMWFVAALAIVGKIYFLYEDKKEIKQQGMQ